MYKVGDEVTVREWNDMVRLYGYNEKGHFIHMGTELFMAAMQKFCGKKLIIKRIRYDPEIGYIYYTNDEESWAWTKNMFKRPIFGELLTKEQAIKVIRWYFSRNDMVENDIKRFEELDGDAFRLYLRRDYGRRLREGKRRIRVNGHLIKPDFVTEACKWRDAETVYVIVAVKDIPRKWQFIEIQCKRHGLYKSARIARKIDRILSDIYEIEHTAQWKEFYNTWKHEPISVHKIYDIAGTAAYCVGCLRNECVHCLFAKVAGSCLSRDSLYRHFLTTLLDEAYKVTKCPH